MAWLQRKNAVPFVVLIVLGFILFSVLKQPQDQRVKDTRKFLQPDSHQAERPHRVESSCDCKNKCEYGLLLSMKQESCCQCEEVGPAPDRFKINIVTTKGPIVLEMHREWSPHGVDRVYELVKLGFCDITAKSRGISLFRAVPNFVVQFGIHGDPSVAKYWRDRSVPDDAPKASNEKGFLTFAAAGPNTRTSQLFLNLKDNAFLDKQGFAPLGKIIEGIEVLERVNMKHGEKPNQGLIQRDGQAYLDEHFPDLDYITHCSISF